MKSSQRVIPFKFTVLMPASDVLERARALNYRKDGTLLKEVDLQASVQHDTFVLEQSIGPGISGQIRAQVATQESVTVVTGEAAVAQYSWQLPYLSYFLCLQAVPLFLFAAWIDPQVKLWMVGAYVAASAALCTIIVYATHAAGKDHRDKMLQRLLHHFSAAPHTGQR